METEGPMYNAFFQGDPLASEVISFDPYLAGISESLLSEPANQLTLMNVLKQRMMVSMVHLKLMDTLRAETEKLIAQMNSVIDD